MGLGSLPERRRPPGCAATASRVILYLIILAVAALFTLVLLIVIRRAYPTLGRSFEANRAGFLCSTTAPPGQHD